MSTRSSKKSRRGGIDSVVNTRRKFFGGTSGHDAKRHNGGTTRNSLVNEKSDVSLIFPFDVRFEYSGNVKLRSLKFCFVKPSHKKSFSRKADIDVEYVEDEGEDDENVSRIQPNDFLLTQKVLTIPWSYNLYVLVDSTNELFNVNFLTLLVGDMLNSLRIVQAERTRSDGVRTSNDVSCSGSGGGVDGGGIGGNSSGGGSGGTRTTTNRVAGNSSNRGKTCAGHMIANEVEVKFNYVIRDMVVSTTSLYDFMNEVASSYAYETTSHHEECDIATDVDSSKNLDGNVDDTAEEEDTFVKSRTDDDCNSTIDDTKDLSLRRAHVLYYCSFSSRTDFRHVLDNLSSNCAHWSNFFNVPVGQENDCLRFTLDVFARNLLLERERERDLKVNFDPASRCVEMAESLLCNDSLDYDDDDEDNDLLVADNSANANPSKRRRVTMNSTECEKSEKCDKSNNLTGDGTIVDDDDIDDEQMVTVNIEDPKASVNLFEQFSMACWCVYDSSSRYLARINLDDFETLFSRENEFYELHVLSRLSLEERKNFFKDLYDTPFAFMPVVAWDIETIARNPSTLPRGVTADECLVSIAVVVERPRSDIGRLALVWVYVPASRDSSKDEVLIEREALKRAKLLTRDGECDVSTVKIFPYENERAMLYDFCAQMISGAVYLDFFFGIRSEFSSVYDSAAVFLVGHNSISYDYSFLLNRLLYFDFFDLVAYLRLYLSRSNDTAHSFCFNESQICVDTMQFLRARMRHLSSFDLRSVLRHYKCEILKQNLDAVAIRSFYYELLFNDSAPTEISNRQAVDVEMKKSKQTRKRRLDLSAMCAVSGANARYRYYVAFLRYNLFDCLSLCDLLNKLAFTSYATVLMRYFGSTFNAALYKGNSHLLPSLMINDCLSNKREFLVPTHDNLSITNLSNVKAISLVDAVDKWSRKIHPTNRANLSSSSSSSSSAIARRYSLHLAFERFSQSSSLSTRNPLSEFVDYFRTLRFSNEFVVAAFDIADAGEFGCPTNEFSVKLISSAYRLPWDLRRLESSSTSTVANIGMIEEFQNFYSVPTDDQLALLRIGEKTYVGGMNFAFPCHFKYPILMDYNSFYPSIIRHYRLDVNNVFVTTLKKLLILVDASFLDRLISCRVIRIFDYTSLADVDAFVERNVFRYRESSFDDNDDDSKEWYEGIELTNLETLMLSSRRLDRRLLVLFHKIDDSIVDRVVTQALERRAVWKRLKKQFPNDAIIASKELTDKLLANGTYGYLNYSRSVIFSRATAAAVTLLCRNAFSRTRFIIESSDFLTSLGVDANAWRARVVYIDTDGCIVILRRRDPTNSSTSLIFDESAFDLSQAGRCKIFERKINHFYPGYTFVDEGVVAASDNFYDYVQQKRIFVDRVNRCLDMRHVLLAAEHENAIGGSVFATKKYALYKLKDRLTYDKLSNSSSLLSFARIQDFVKKTGFESNASRPIKRLYDILLRNVNLINHTYGLVASDCFVTKIVHHRFFFHALFDRLYAMWRSCLRRYRARESKDRDLFVKGLHRNARNNERDENDEMARLLNAEIISNCDVEDDEENDEECDVNDFSSRAPLNPKDTSGPMSEFIDRVLRDHQYDVGERVRFMKLVPTDPVRDSRIVRIQPDPFGDRPPREYHLLDLTESRFELFDVLRDSGDLDDVLPNFKYFLGGHATYMYQCVEGFQTLRDKSNEAVEWLEKDSFFRHLKRMKRKHNFRYREQQQRANRDNNLNEDDDDDDRVVKDEMDKDIMYLRSFDTIFDFNYATWLWSRILAPKFRISKLDPENVILLWNSKAKVDFKKMPGKKIEAMIQADSFVKQYNVLAPPKILSVSFFRKWCGFFPLKDKVNVTDKNRLNLFRDGLFTDIGENLTRVDYDRKIELLSSGHILYKNCE